MDVHPSAQVSIEQFVATLILAIIGNSPPLNHPVHSVGLIANPVAG